MTQPVYDKYQLRLTLTDSFARAARETPYSAVLEPLHDVLRKHDASLSCQYDEFVRFVAACEAHNDADTTLAQWTKAVLAMPSKVDYFKTLFVVAVKGEQLFDETTMTALKNDLEPLVESGMVKKLSSISNDPAKNPQAPRKFRPAGDRPQ